MEPSSPPISFKRTIHTDESDNESEEYSSKIESPTKNLTKSTKTPFDFHDLNFEASKNLAALDKVSAPSIRLLVEELTSVTDAKTFKDELIRTADNSEKDSSFMYYFLSSRINSEENSTIIATYDNQILPKNNPQKTNCVLYIPFSTLSQKVSPKSIEMNLSETEWYHALTTRHSSDTGVFSIILPITQNDNLSIVWILLDPANRSYKIYCKNSRYIQSKNNIKKTHDLSSLFPEVSGTSEKLIKNFNILIKLLREAVKDLFSINDMLHYWEALPGYIPTSSSYRYIAGVLDMYDICIAHINIQDPIKMFLSEEYQISQKLDDATFQYEREAMLKAFAQEYGRFYKVKIRNDGTINTQLFQNDKKFYFSKRLFEEFQMVYEIFSVHFLLHEVFTAEVSLHGNVDDRFSPFLSFWFPNLLEQYNKLSNHDANLWLPYFCSVYYRKSGSYNDHISLKSEKRHTNYPPLPFLRPINLFLPHEMLSFCQKYFVSKSDDDVKNLLKPGSSYSEPNKEVINAFRRVLKKIIRGLGLDSGLSPLKLQMEEPTLILEELIDSIHYDTFESIIRRYKCSLIMAYIQDNHSIAISKPLNEESKEKPNKNQKPSKWSNSPVLVYYSRSSKKSKGDHMKYKQVLNAKELFQSIILDCQTPPIGRTAPLEPWNNDDEISPMFYNQHWSTGLVSKSLLESTYRQNVVIVRLIRRCYVKSHQDTVKNRTAITSSYFRRKKRKTETPKRITRRSKIQMEPEKDEAIEDENIVLIDEVIGENSPQDESISSSSNTSTINLDDSVDLSELSDSDEEIIQSMERFEAQPVNATLTASTPQSTTAISTQLANNVITQSFAKAVTQSVTKAMTKSVTKPIENSVSQSFAKSVTGLSTKIAKKSVYQIPPKEQPKHFRVKETPQKSIPEFVSSEDFSSTQRQDRPRRTKKKEPQPQPESDGIETEEPTKEEDSVIVVDEILSPRTLRLMNRKRSPSVEDVIEIE